MNFILCNFIDKKKLNMNQEGNKYAKVWAGHFEKYLKINVGDRVEHFENI